jgi:hypothetical protein
MLDRLSTSTVLIHSGTRCNRRAVASDLVRPSGTMIR